jgi:hypothetical protein
MSKALVDERNRRLRDLSHELSESRHHGRFSIGPALRRPRAISCARSRWRCPPTRQAEGANPHQVCDSGSRACANRRATAKPIGSHCRKAGQRLLTVSVRRRADDVCRGMREPRRTRRSAPHGEVEYDVTTPDASYVTGQVRSSRSMRPTRAASTAARSRRSSLL